MIFLNPAASLMHELQVGHENPQFFEPGYEEPKECWWIQEIAVAPEFQRQGVGKLLLQWGMERAREENVPVTLSSTPAGKALYEGSGFKPCGTWKWHKKVDETYTMMRWDPPVR